MAAKKSRARRYVVLELDWLTSIAIAIAIAAAFFIFSNSDILTVLSFAALVPVFVFFRLDGRVPVGFAALMLLLAGAALGFLNNLNVANQLAVYAYLLLVVGVVCLVIEQIRNRKKR